MTQNRRIVIHHCRPSQIELGLLSPGDTVFFDDCLWSQYSFIRNNIQKLRNIRIILGFSSGLARPPSYQPIEFIESNLAHDAVNKAMSTYGDPYPDEIRAFMSVDEIRELANLHNVKVAMHGCVHLRLERMRGRINRLSAFRRDVEDGVVLFRKYGFQPKIFVYPYAFCEDGYDFILKKFGFDELYAKPGAYRISMENLEKSQARNITSLQGVI